MRPAWSGIWLSCQNTCQHLKWKDLIILLFSMCTAFMDLCSYIIHFFAGALESLWKNLLTVDFLEWTNGEFDPKRGPLGWAFDFRVKTLVSITIKRISVILSFRMFEHVHHVHGSLLLYYSLLCQWSIYEPLKKPVKHGLSGMNVLLEWTNLSKTSFWDLHLKDMSVVFRDHPPLPLANIVFLEIENLHGKKFIGTVYHPPSANLHEFVESFQQLLDRVTRDVLHNWWFQFRPS